MTNRRMGWVLAASFWALFGIITGIQVWISMLTHGHSLLRLVGYYFAVWEAWLAPTALIVWLARRWTVVPPRRMHVLIHLLAACAIAVIHGLYWLALLISIRPFDRMTVEVSRLHVSEILFDRLGLEWTLYCLVLGSALAFDYYERYSERALKTAQLETLLADARLHALELQIQPHFLFNTLNSISALVRSRRNDEAVTMMAGLSELLRYTLDHAGDQRVTLEEEFAVLRRYLEIQRARFSDRMSFEIQVSPEARLGAVPTFLLQPLAENAVRHGIAVSASPGVVEVRAFRSNDRLQIDLFNSGSVRLTSERGIGLSNTLERLKTLYGDTFRFELANAHGGVLASLSIPWSELA